MLDSSGAATAPSERLRPTEFSAPLFGELMAQMREGGRWVILDLGQVQPTTVDLFSQIRCRLDIADLPADLEEVKAEDEPLALKKQFARILSDRSGSTKDADVILCWDILNYLGRPALTALMRRIATRARPGALLHALISYSKPQMPARPGILHPSKDDHLVYLPTTAEECKATRYTPKDLERHMQGFRADQRRLLNNGMQEYLFRL